MIQVQAADGDGRSGRFAGTPPARGNVRGRSRRCGTRKGETSGKERINLIVHAGSGDWRQRGADAVQCRDGKDGKVDGASFT